ncbi:hypothetical protein V6N13_017264 [Hibiscus sabdariffa]|uniref:Uncharacterized protein n=1 Tax=Hibiscus sabdariffa TaxID=183260 RepID=A0ABR2CYT7_9ROSI
MSHAMIVVFILAVKHMLFVQNMLSEKIEALIHPKAHLDGKELKVIFQGVAGVIPCKRFEFLQKCNGEFLYAPRRLIANPVDVLFVLKGSLFLIFF